jgi:hypothetical protein
MEMSTALKVVNQLRPEFIRRAVRPEGAAQAVYSPSLPPQGGRIEGYSISANLTRPLSRSAQNERTRSS